MVGFGLGGELQILNNTAILQVFRTGKAGGRGGSRAWGELSTIRRDGGGAGGGLELQDNRGLTSQRGGVFSG